MRKPNAPQMISLFSGRIGLGAAWQSSTVPPSTSFGMHSASKWEAPFSSARSSASWMTSSSLGVVPPDPPSWAATGSAVRPSTATTASRRPRAPTVLRT